MQIFQEPLTRFHIYKVLKNNESPWDFGQFGHRERAELETEKTRFCVEKWELGDSPSTGVMTSLIIIFYKWSEGGNWKMSRIF